MIFKFCNIINNNKIIMTQKNSSHMVPMTYIYSVEGNIGSGKSTFVKFMKEKPKVFY